MAGADENQHGHQSNQRVRRGPEQPGRQVAPRSPAAKGLDGDRRRVAHEERRRDSQEKDQRVEAELAARRRPDQKRADPPDPGAVLGGDEVMPPPQTAIEQSEWRTGCVGRHRIGTESEFPDKGITSTM